MNLHVDFSNCDEPVFSAATADEFDVIYPGVGDAVREVIAIAADLEVPEIRLDITTFDHTVDAEGRDCWKNKGTRRPVTWSGLCHEFEQPDVWPCKGKQPLISFALRPGNSKKSGTIPLSVCAVCGDYDAGKVSIDEAGARLRAKGLLACLYTTARHTPEKPRWRVVAPLANPIDPCEYREMVDALNGAVGGILAGESWEVTRNYYAGQVQGVVYCFEQVSGSPLDALMFAGVDWKPIGEPEPTQTKTQTVKQAHAVDTDRQLDRAIALDRASPETIADLRLALEFFSADDADDYHVWVHEVGMGLASLKDTLFEDDAHDLFHTFSSKSLRYDYDQTEGKWASFSNTQSTYLKIFALAQEKGWINPNSAEALKANATAETRQDRTDAGNVALLVIITNGNLRYVPERRLWLPWDGERWEPDEYGTNAQRAALEVAEHYHRKAADIRRDARATHLNSAERKKLEKVAEHIEKWATQCRNRRSIDNMLNLAKGDTRFTLPVSALDCDPFLFGVANGVVDLRTGTLRAAGREDFVTRRSPVRFDPGAKAPRWVKFIEEITAKPAGGAAGSYTARPALAQYIQRALGYAMTGSTAEHKMFVAVGQGSNGKNVLLDLLQWLMGHYCQTIPPEALMVTRYDADAERPSPTAAKLAGARCAISSESRDGARLDVALVKRHTGGGFMTARYMRENSFRFEITHKLFLMTNHRPALDHLDDAMRGRLHLIPFDMRWNRPGHPERNPALPDGDKDLPAKLKLEAEGVLAWLVAGAVAYLRDGLEPPPEVVHMTREFFLDQDPLGRWLATCDTCEPKQGATASELFSAFGTWQALEAEEGGPVSQKAFSTELLARGIPKHQGNKANRYGLRAKS